MRAYALEIGYNVETREVRNIGESWDFAATWACVLEGVAEIVMQTEAIATLKRERANVDAQGRDLYRVTIEDRDGSVETRWYLVGARPFGIARDWDAVRDAEMDYQDTPGGE